VVVRRVVVVPGTGLGDRGLVDGRVPEARGLGDRLAVEGEGDGPADVDVIERLPLLVEREVPVVGAGGGAELDVIVVLEGGDLLLREVVGPRSESSS
jgi:hypothetical protein